MREGSRVALLSLGTRLAECLKAAEELDGAAGCSTTVADARFAKPLDTELVDRLAREHEVLITVEEGSIGGFGSFVLQHLAEAGLLDGGLRVRSMVLPDSFIDHDKPEKHVRLGRPRRQGHRRQGAGHAGRRSRQALRRRGREGRRRQGRGRQERRQQGLNVRAINAAASAGASGVAALPALDDPVSHARLVLPSGARVIRARA